MVASNYSRGARFEYRVRDALIALGYIVIRAAGSHGIADLVALHRHRLLLVQCKRNGTCPPAEREELERLADALTGDVRVDAIIASAPTPRAGILFAEVLNGTPRLDPDLRPVPL